MKPPSTVPANFDCVACKFAGCQKYGEKVCFLTGGKCKKETEAAEVTLTPAGRTVWLLWAAVQSQWRTGFSGPTGLDYGAVKTVADTLGIEWDETMLRHIQALEGATLKHISDEQKKAEKK